VHLPGTVTGLTSLDHNTGNKYMTEVDSGHVGNVVVAEKY